MFRLRRQIHARPGLALLLLAAGLLMRVLVPAGYMPDFSGGTFEVALCTGHGPAHMTMAMPGHHHDTPSDDHDKNKAPCLFGGLAAPALSGAGPIQLALALAFIVAAAFFIRPVFVAPRFARLRPPLRGPPVTP